ncbi:MAG TPA: oxidoreductase, partial [Massilia timonae]|nr:oxidoreductase [Massilia timonae]
RNWLLFGERNAAHDFLCREELEAWRDGGMLARLDLAFSRDEGKARYVQHLVDAHQEELRRWVADGAAVYVCGSLQGMAGGVHDALVSALGLDTVDAMAADGRYRRDVY